MYFPKDFSHYALLKGHKVTIVIMLLKEITFFLIFAG